MTDYIGREWLLDVVENVIEWDTERDRNRAIHQVRELTPAADVVARDCFDRVLADNDTMRYQLAQIGKKPGDSMDDVVVVADEANIQSVHAAIYDTEEVHENCTVQILSNSVTGDISVGWWPNDEDWDEPDE